MTKFATRALLALSKDEHGLTAVEYAVAGGLIAAVGNINILLAG